MDPFFTSTVAVALAEVGDKTQLLALFLAARFRRPVPIVLGILVATLANHAAAAWLGLLVADLLQGDWLRWGLGLSFIAMALWTLKPDRMDEAPDRAGKGAFVATTIAFFVVEIGDKTQVATSMLAAQFHVVLPVMLGSTLGMLLANVPVVILGERLMRRLPERAIRIGAALLFAGLGGWLLLAR